MDVVGVFHSSHLGTWSTGVKSAFTDGSYALLALIIVTLDSVAPWRIFYHVLVWVNPTDPTYKVNELCRTP